MAPPDPAPRLLTHLRRELGAPALDLAESLAPISGGFDTRIFAFRLSGAPGEWARPLILRILMPDYSPARALREAAVQNAVSHLGFPAPRVLAASADPGILGGAFLVMERAEGRPMLEAKRLGVGTTLARLQLALHALDARPLIEAMEQLGEARAMTFDGILDQLEQHVIGQSLDGLRGVMSWLRERRPPPPERTVICHGDFHPQNVLMARSTVTGVIDWPNAAVADPAYDVAGTHVILAHVPLALAAMPAPMRALASLARPALLATYRAGYRRGRAIGRREFDYYQVAGAMRHLVRVAALRQAAASGRASLGPLERSDFGERLCRTVARLSGVAPSLPAVSP